MKHLKTYENLLTKNPDGSWTNTPDGYIEKEYLVGDFVLVHNEFIGNNQPAKIIKIDDSIRNLDNEYKPAAFKMQYLPNAGYIIKFPYIRRDQFIRKLTTEEREIFIIELESQKYNL